MHPTAKPKTSLESTRV